MLKQKVEKAINKQINAELWSAYLYLSMSSYLESKNLSGFASWMIMQSQEEVNHAMRLYNYVIERGGRVNLEPIEKVPTEWKSPLHVFEETLKHEQKVTGLIEKLVDVAEQEKDRASINMLQWFIDEQVEEESSADEIVQKLHLIGNNGNGIFMLDNELGQRVFTGDITARQIQQE
jgi:ferritin